MILKEFQFLQCKYQDEESNYIHENTFNELETFVLENEETAQYLKITTKKGYGKILQAQNYVGVIQTKDGTNIEILPKIADISEDDDGRDARKILIKMLKTLKKSPFKQFNMAQLKSTKMPLLEIFIVMFLDELAKLIHKGIKSDYINQEQITDVNGKILFQNIQTKE